VCQDYQDIENEEQLQEALEYADEIISVPRAHVRVTLRQVNDGVTLFHEGRALTKCYLTRPGMRAARFMAEALGVEVPPLGELVEARVSTGVLWRAVSISCLDLGKQESYLILERLLEEARMQRGSGSDNV
jgi:hypothetical protein